MELFDMDLTKKWATYRCVTCNDVKKIVSNPNRVKTIEEIDKESDRLILLDKIKREEYLRKYNDKYKK